MENRILESGRWVIAAAGFFMHGLVVLRGRIRHHAGLHC